MGAVDHPTTATVAIHPAWEILDDASQVLVRVEALVELLRGSRDVEEHHRYGAEIACDLLRTLKEKLSDAQEQVRHVAPATSHPSSGGP